MRNLSSKKIDNWVSIFWMPGKVLENRWGLPAGASPIKITAIPVQNAACWRGDIGENDAPRVHTYTKLY